MTTISLHMNLHQPFLLKELSMFYVDDYTEYADYTKTKFEVNNLADNQVLPLNKMLLEKIKTSKKKLKFSLSVTGTTLELFEQYRKDVLLSFKKLLQTGCVQFVSQSFYHSPASSFSKDEYEEQLRQFDQYIYSLFKQFPVPSKNNHPHSTELSCHVSCNGNCKRQKTMKLWVDYRLFADTEKRNSFSQKLDTMLSSDEYEFSLTESSVGLYSATKELKDNSLLQRIYRITNLVLSSHNPLLIKWWRRLQDVSYYSASFQSQTEIYVRNILASMEVILLRQILAKRKHTPNQQSFLL
jgi:hypothetical protein